MVVYAVGFIAGSNTKAPTGEVGGVEEKIYEMEVIIKGEPKEIAALVLAAQERRSEEERIEQLELAMIDLGARTVQES